MQKKEEGVGALLPFALKKKKNNDEHTDFRAHTHTRARIHKIMERRKPQNLLVDGHSASTYSNVTDEAVSEHELVDEFGELMNGAGYFVYKVAITLFLLLAVIFVGIALRFDGMDKCSTEPYSLECTKFTRSELEGVCELSEAVNRTCVPTEAQACGGRGTTLLTDPANECRVGLELDDGSYEWFSAPTSTNCSSKCLATTGYCKGGRCEGRCIDARCRRGCFCQDLGTGINVFDYIHDPLTGDVDHPAPSSFVCDYASGNPPKYLIFYNCYQDFAARAPGLRTSMCTYTVLENPCFLYPNPAVFGDGPLYPGGQHAFPWPATNPMATDGCMSLVSPEWRECMEVTNMYQHGARIIGCMYRHKCHLNDDVHGANRTFTAAAMKRPQFEIRPTIVWNLGTLQPFDSAGSGAFCGQPQGEYGYSLPNYQGNWGNDQEYYDNQEYLLRDAPEDAGEPGWTRDALTQAAWRRRREQTRRQEHWRSPHNRLHHHAVSQGYFGKPPPVSALRDGMSPPGEAPRAPPPGHHEAQQAALGGAPNEGLLNNRHHGSSVGMGVDQMTMEGLWNARLPSPDKAWDMLHPKASPATSEEN